MNFEDLRQEPDTAAAYHSTDDHNVETCGECLNSTTNGENDSPSEEGPLPANYVADATSSNRRGC